MISVVGSLLVLIFVLLLARGFRVLNEGNRESAGLLKAAGWVMIIAGALGTIYGVIVTAHLGDGGRDRDRHARHSRAVHAHAHAGDHAGMRGAGTGEHAMPGGMTHDVEVRHMMDGEIAVEVEVERIPEGEAAPEDGGE